MLGFTRVAIDVFKIRRGIKDSIQTTGGPSISGRDGFRIYSGLSLPLRFERWWDCQMFLVNDGTVSGMSSRTSSLQAKPGPCGRSSDAEALSWSSVCWTVSCVHTVMEEIVLRSKTLRLFWSILNSLQQNQLRAPSQVSLPHPRSWPKPFVLPRDRGETLRGTPHGPHGMQAHCRDSKEHAGGAAHCK